MRGTSRVSFEAAEQAFEPVLAAAGAEATSLGQELFALVDALDGSGSLRRTLTDPALGGDAKAGLVGRLLGGADPRTVAAVQDLVRRRWSAQEDLAEAVEGLAFHAVLASAQARGELDRVEDELFRFSRVLVAQREVRQTLVEPRIAPEARAGLVEQILGGRATPETLQLARRAAAAPRGRRYAATLGRLSDVAAQRRSRSVATVTTVAPLRPEQERRLSDLLRRASGRAVQLHVVVDPTVIGGLRVQLGPQVMDATTLSRLADARRRLAG
ncbi:F0F1 ATP synthase subunit delta [Cellulomonas marina]|uniref:ATP synthase subunit delta n=1 Tax=Cellulomonas marina TaxID=988821 RepID=A0A1I1ASW8_9CELL|nr:F0F1 ATP synthase subunit delta [Cellulomonas marina]GIG30242.1 ATP synthase subunit delta [Cellulomonas marina]SFB41165.1 F-type H+-transporting ATPase subunit delta [Cellulomonas marina]